MLYLTKDFIADCTPSTAILHHGTEEFLGNTLSNWTWEEFYVSGIQYKEKCQREVEIEREVKENLKNLSNFSSIFFIPHGNNVTKILENNFYLAITHNHGNVFKVSEINYSQCFQSNLKIKVSSPLEDNNIPFWVIHKINDINTFVKVNELRLQILKNIQVVI